MTLQISTLIGFVDVVLGVMLLEALVLAWLASRGRLPLGSTLAGLAAGAGLLAAMRAALAGAAPLWVAACLLAALAAHLLDLKLRWQRSARA